MYLRILALRPGDKNALMDLAKLAAASPLPPLAATTETLPWRSTQIEPAAQWTAPSFDDSTWTPAAQPGPSWWRAPFELPNAPTEPLVIALKGVKRGEIYLNGVAAGPEFVAVSEKGHWVVSSPDATRALRAGRNIVAVRVTELSPTAPFRVTLHPFPPLGAEGGESH
jgi:hypothetical protein